MKIKATVTFEYTLADSTIAEFKSHVLEYIQESLDEDNGLSLDDISDESVQEFLNKALPDAIGNMYRGYSSNSGILCDDYFGTVSFDYYGEDVSDLVKDMADIVLSN